MSIEQAELRAMRAERRAARWKQAAKRYRRQMTRQTVECADVDEAYREAIQVEPPRVHYAPSGLPTTVSHPTRVGRVTAVREALEQLVATVYAEGVTPISSKPAARAPEYCTHQYRSLAGDWWFVALGPSIAARVPDDVDWLIPIDGEA